MTPRISIIVPVFNVERYLPACLDSLLGQTLRDIEIICVEDCSKDGSPEVLARCAALDSRIKVVRHEVNRGLSAARNTGMRAALAPWVLFVDSDDLVSSRICERTLKVAIATDADVVFFAHAAFVDGTTPPPEPPECEPTFPARRELLGRQAFAWTKLMKTELLKGRGIEFPEGLCFEDVPVHWRLALESPKPVFLDEALVWYRQRAGSITYRKDWTRADGIKIYDLIGDWLQRNGFWIEYGDLFLVAEMVNLANTHAYYALANPALLHRVSEEARQRMTPRHWHLALLGEGLLGWQRDYILVRCRPSGVATPALVLLATIRHHARHVLRRLYHNLRK
jgi:glycosyltransferase involved in cell wall biosynthesis